MAGTSRPDARDSADDKALLVEYDAIIIGAGAGGISALYQLRNMGLKCRAFESGHGPGGAWYWNRYPGARTDSESYSYGFFFSEELFREWRWSEHFAGQPETERYFNFVIDRLDLRKDIQFASPVQAAHFDEGAHVWHVTLENGERYRARWVVAAVGPLTRPQLPKIDGIETFAGEAYHTARWPKHPVHFEGKRVGVIGTGASGVQVIQEAAKTAGQLVVFQRTANYMAPLNNGPISDEEWQEILASFEQLRQRVNSTWAWFLHTPDPRSIFDVPDEERERFFDEKYNARGMGIWQGNFHDIAIDRRANDLISDYIRRKIRERVRDPKIAEKLIPKDHGFGTRRVPHETGYYEVYNQPNVTLVDLRETPITRIRPEGVETTAGMHELDMLVYATGFDAVTGAFEAIDIRGTGGRKLDDKWADGPITHLGVMTTGFPNFFMPAGPLTAQGNIPRTCEYNAWWITEVVRFMQENEYSWFEPSPEAEQEWTEHARQVHANLLTSEVDSWFTGVNRNRDGRTSRRVVQYRGGAPIYREKCEETVRNGFPEFIKKSARPLHPKGEKAAIVDGVRR